MTRETLAGVAACALTALIVAFHIQRAQNAGGLWRDEIGTIDTAAAPSVPAFWRALTYSTPPALPYLGARVWITFAGSSDASLRGLGLVGGLGLLATLWFTLRGFGCRFPLLALMLFAANGTVIRWGDAFRGYGLACLAIMLTYLALWRLIETPTMLSTLLALLASIVSVHVALQNTALVATLWLGAVVASLAAGKLKSAVGVLIVSLVTLLSVIPYAAAASEYQTLNAVPSEAFAVKTVLARLVFTSSSDSPLILCAWLAFLLGALVAGLGAVVSRPSPPAPALRQSLYHCMVLVVAVPAFIAFCRGARVQVNPWHCLMVLAVLAVAAESLITRVMSEQVSTIGRVAAVCLVAWAALPRTAREITVRQTNLDVIAQHVGGAAGPKDFIVINPWFLSLPFHWYYRGQATWSTLPPLPPALVHRYDLLIQKTTEPDPNATLYTSIEETLRAGNHVWMVGVVAVPRDGEVVPARPTPVPPQTALTGDYVHAWTLQLGAWLTSHGVAVAPVDLGLRRTVSVYENATLYKLSGWRQ